MKRLVLAAGAALLLSAAPAMAMSCCGGSKGKAGMCAKSGAMAMNMKGKKGGCCCDKMGRGGMSHRA